MNLLKLEQSDLFFNLGKETWASAPSPEDGWTRESVIEAVMPDAVAAIERYPHAFNGWSAQELAENFADRL